MSIAIIDKCRCENTVSPRVVYAVGIALGVWIEKMKHVCPDASEIFFDYVLEVEDSSGELEVKHRGFIPASIMQAFMDAWEMVGESSENVGFTHKSIGEPVGGVYD